MKTRLGVAAAALLVCVSARAQVTIQGSSRQVTTDPSLQTDPSVSGDVVVYTDWRNGNGDIYMTDLLTGVETPVVVGPGDQILQDVSGGTVVYGDSAVSGAEIIMAYDIGTGSRMQVTAGQPSETAPTISYPWVCFQGSSSVGPTNGIYAFDLTSNQAVTVMEESSVGANLLYPRVDGVRVVYQRNSLPGWDVEIADLATGGITQLATGIGTRPEPDVSGDRVVWVTLSAAGDKDLVLADLVAGTQTVLTLPGDQSRPRLAGDLLAFDDRQGTEYDVVLYHIPSGTTQRLGGAGTSEFLNDITPGKVAYVSNAAGNFDVWVYEYTVSTPPPPPPADACARTDAPDATLTFTSSASATVSGQGSAQVAVHASGCAAASVVVDGQVLLGPSDFNGQDTCASFDLTLAGTSTVEVTMPPGFSDPGPGCHEDEGDDEHGGHAGARDDEGEGHGDHDGARGEDGDHGAHEGARGDDEDDEDHGEHHGARGDDDEDDDHCGAPPPPQCTITVDVWSSGAAGAAGGVAFAQPLAGAVVTPPAAGCETSPGVASAWLLLLVAGAMLTARRRAPARVRRSDRR